MARREILCLPHTSANFCIFLRHVRVELQGVDMQTHADRLSNDGTQLGPEVTRPFRIKEIDPYHDLLGV